MRVHRACGQASELGFSATNTLLDGCWQRRERNTMVQTEEQYVFIYQALRDALEPGVADIPEADLASFVAALQQTDGTAGCTKLEAEFKLLSNPTAVDAAWLRTDARSREP